MGDSNCLLLFRGRELTQQFPNEKRHHIRVPNAPWEETFLKDWIQHLSLIHSITHTPHDTFASTCQGIHTARSCLTSRKIFILNLFLKASGTLIWLGAINLKDISFALIWLGL